MNFNLKNKPIIGIVTKHYLTNNIRPDMYIRDEVKQAVYDNDIPILGLCCGQNVMVRALNGTTKRVLNPEKHMNKKDRYVHKIFIKKTPTFIK